MPHERCQHLESYGLARTAERALLLTLSASPERVPRAVDWGAIFEDTTVATAVLDRLLHHASVLSVTGDSYRMRRHRDAIAALRPALTGHPQGGESR